MRFSKILLATLILSVLATASADAEPLRLRVGWIAPVSDLVSIAFLKPGIAKHNGQSYAMELTHFQGSSQEMSALATGELEIGLLGFSTFPIAVENAGLGDLRIIADEIQDGVHGYYSNQFMVRDDSPIRTVSDLKGRIVTTNAVGSGLDIAMKVMFAKHGLGAPHALTYVEAPLPAMTSMLVQRKVDLIPSLPPFCYTPELQKSARTLFTEKDALGPNELAFFVARRPFLDRHKAAVIDFLEDYLRAVRWYTDPAHHDEAVAIAAKFVKLPPTVFEGWAFTKKDVYRDPNGVLNAHALQSNIELEVKIGFIKRNIDVVDYVDRDLVATAAKRLR
ncbi:MAG TPA: ABC transporter substrate-binding protein [Candidatus Binataceae bacterium]|nr:ABC transporter substrate-binding protein [Candidatus Binataceae bacterium]